MLWPFRSLFKNIYIEHKIKLKCSVNEQTTNDGLNVVKLC